MEVTLEVVDEAVGRRRAVEANIAFEIILRPATFAVAVRDFPIDRIPDNRIIRKILIDAADGGGPAFAGITLPEADEVPKNFRAMLCGINTWSAMSKARRSPSIMVNSNTSA